MDKIKKESELSAPTKQFLIDMGCTSLYGEVLDIDLVGINEHIIYAVELKTSLNIKVLEQALNRKNYANYIYIAVPNSSLPGYYYGINNVYRLFLEYHGIGLIGIEKTSKFGFETIYYYKIYKHSKINRTVKRRHWLIPKLTSQKLNHDGGLQSHEVESPYKWMIDEVKDYLKRKRRRGGEGWTSLDEIIDCCKKVSEHYASPKGSLRQTLRASFNCDWVEIDKKMYRFKNNNEKENN